MFALLFFLFLALPILEIYVIIQVGQVIGGWETIGLMILVSVLGAWMVRREGLSLISRVQSQLNQGELPTKELVDGLLVALAGALMLTPGFITDGVGLLCLFPPTRAAIRTYLIRRYRGRSTITTSVPPGFGDGGPGSGARGPGFGTGPQGSGPVYDVGEASYDKTDDDDRPELD